MVPELIGPNITLGEHVIFQEILALTRVRHTISSKKVTAQSKM